MLKQEHSPVVTQFAFERFNSPARRRRRVNCEALLEAVVIAVRDNAAKRDVAEILKCYPRVKNRIDNPYIVLIDEIVRVRRERDIAVNALAELSQQQLRNNV